MTFLMGGGKGENWGSRMTHGNMGIAVSLHPSEGNTPEPGYLCDTYD